MDEITLVASEYLDVPLYLRSVDDLRQYLDTRITYLREQREIAETKQDNLYRLAQLCELMKLRAHCRVLLEQRPVPFDDGE